MNLRDLNYELELADEKVRPFERKVLESGLCDFAVPMTFFRQKGKQKIRYDCSGYIALSELDFIDTENIFDIIEKTLLALRKSGEFLIEPGTIRLTLETVYVHHKHKDVRIAYMPGLHEVNRLQHHLLEFILLVEERMPKSGKEYTGQLKEEIVRNNRSITDLITIVGEIRREIQLSMIP
jgi:hypothetical protein